MGDNLKISFMFHIIIAKKKKQANKALSFLPERAAGLTILLSMYCVPYGSPGGTFLLITYHLLLTTYYLSLITYNLLLITYYLLLITYHIIYNPNNGGKLHCTFPVKVVVVVEAVVVVVYV